MMSCRRPSPAAESPPAVIPTPRSLPDASDGRDAETIHAFPHEVEPPRENVAFRSRRIAEGQVVPRLPDLVREVDEHVLDLRVLLEAVDAQVLPEAALLVPSVRHLSQDRQVVVDLR